MTSLRCITLLLLLGVTTGCDPATNETFEGVPLASLKGTMTARENLVLTHPVRLAIAWFANFHQAGVPSAPPRGVVTDEVSYEGTFPQAFNFSLTSLPPEDAVTTDATGLRGAVGVLLAYEDLDGDGQLTISATGPVTDRVLGASASVLVHLLEPANQSQHFLTYVEALPADAPPGATSGYNLVSNVQADSGVAQQWGALSTAQLPLELTGDPALNLLACSEFYQRLGTASLGAGACGIASASSTSLPISAMVQLSGASASAFVTIGGLGADGGFEVAPGAQDAGVTVNGYPLAWNGTSFSLFEANRAAIIDGRNVVRVAMPGAPIWEEAGLVPPPFSVTAPMTVRAGTTFDVGWVRSPGDDSLFSAISGDQYPPVANDSVQFVSPGQPGSMLVTVLAMNPVLPSPKVRCSRSESVTVTVEP